MACRVELRNALLERDIGTGDGADHDLRSFHRDAHALVDVQARFTRDCGGQSHAQAVAPLFYVEFGFRHFSGLGTVRLDESIDIATRQVKRQNDAKK
jgi:hypothetical protein